MLFGFIQCWLQSLYHRATQRLRQWTRPDNSSDSLAVGMALDLTRSKSELVLENALLRQQLIVLQRQGKRPSLTCGTGPSLSSWPASCQAGERPC
jgi:putative transposase